jgi:hypothetical protein
MSWAGTLWGNNSLGSRILPEAQGRFGASPCLNLLLLATIFPEEAILVFAKDKSIWRPHPLPRSETMDERYKNPYNDPKGPWASTDITRAEHRDRDYWGLTTPSGNEVFPARGRSWSRPFENIEKLKKEGLLWFGPNGDRMPRLKKYLSEMDGGLTPQTIWLNNEVGNTQEANPSSAVRGGRFRIHAGSGAANSIFLHYIC